MEEIKELYEIPLLQIFDLNGTDIITTSDNGFDMEEEL